MLSNVIPHFFFKDFVSSCLYSNVAVLGGLVWFGLGGWAYYGTQYQEHRYKLEVTTDLSRYIVLTSSSDALEQYNFKFDFS